MLAQTVRSKLGFSILTRCQISDVAFILLIKGAKYIGNASVWDLKSRVGEYVKINHIGTAEIYGVDAMNGYHTMLLTYRARGGASEFTLLDQDSATSFLAGRLIFHTASESDSVLEEPVRDRQGKRTKGDTNTPQIFKFIVFFRV